ncbi:hypothetical protein GO755_35020 [Spirosoma sp. HMF4905]|uniref:Tape measure protein n=1 Tax=Spirosoma arboris TaxID=2682092 RepID=A0A7K1SNE9_9BACT|nr:hypothetical protein [Spirosoma arboris]MVM35287.1 hypothetical protein [Spirosoma arboris]
MVNLNEVASLTLQLNQGDVGKSIDTLNTKAKELKTTLKAIETDGGKGSENWQKYKNELADVQKATAALKKDVDVTTLSYGQLDNLIKQLNKDLKTLKPGTDEFITAAKRLGDAEKQFKGVKDEVNKIKEGGDELGKPTLWNKISAGVGTMAKAFNAFMALQVIGFIIDIGKSIFETTAKFEKYGKVLETALGSQEEAKAAMAALKDLGAKTAYSVEELTEGYVKMVNRGLRPSQKEMVAMTDLAASQGKTFDQLVEAALDAQTGENERLKEFGISAKKAGDEVTFSFKGVNTTVKNTPEAIQGAIIAFGQMNGVAGQNAKMMETLEGQASNLGDNFDSLKVEIGDKLKPVFSGLLSLMGVGITVIRNLVGVLATLITGTVSYYKTLADFAVGAGGVMKNMGVAIKEFLSGNFEAAGKAWDQTKAAGAKVITDVKTNVKAGAAAVVAIWSDPANVQKAEFAGKKQGEAHGKGLTDEQKKALEKQANEADKARKADLKEHEKALKEREKANEKALEDLAKLEAAAHVASIKDEMQREFAKLGSERDLKVEAIMRGIQDEQTKNLEIAALDKKLEEDVARVAGEFAEKKRKKAEEEEKARLEAKKFILEQERLAENALLDWKELAAKGNATKLAAVHKERLTIQYTATVEKLNAEEAAERAKAAREITDTSQLAQALTSIEDRYRNDRQLASGKNAAEIEKIEQELKQKKNAIWSETSNAFGALLKGDLSAFVDHANKIVQGEQEAWQKRLQENTEKYAAVGEMAKQAAQFLANLAKERADKEIAEAKRERDEKVAILNDQIETEKLGIDQATEAINQTKEQASEKIKTIKETETQKVTDLETLYSEMSNSQSTADMEAEIQRTTTKSQDKIRQAGQVLDDAVAKATEEKEEKIIAAEATRDAEMASIQKRTDLDSATRKQMIEESKARAELEIKQANEDFETKTKLSKEESEAKIKDATEEADSKTKLLKELETADKDRAKELIQMAKDEADAKVKTAEEEKKAKLKLLEQEKATRIQNKKDLEAAIAEEDRKAKAVEAAAKLKAWKAQQNADIASAVITGALATLKALASGFWPVNLVFAAATAVMTGIQVAMIKRQPQPSFEQGGFIPGGGRHGSTYGAGGLAIVDRATGREQGEMEGGEAIISREQTRANLPFIRRMFANARTPGKRSSPVTDFRAPAFRGAAFREGGLMDGRAWSGKMFRYGGYVPKRYEDGGVADYSSDGEGPLGGADQANQAQAQAVEQGKQQLKVLGEIQDAIKAADTSQQQAMSRLANSVAYSLDVSTRSNAQAMDNLATTTKNGLESLAFSTKTGLNGMGSQVASLKCSINAVEGAVYQVRDSVNGTTNAVYNTNQAGRLDNLIGAISVFGRLK